MSNIPKCPLKYSEIFKTDTGYTAIVLKLGLPDNEVAILKQQLPEFGMPTEWFTGYVIVPNNHKLVDKHIETTDKILANDFLRGITYSDTVENFVKNNSLEIKENGYVIGVDYLHAWDMNNPQINLDYVKNELQDLAKALKKHE